MDIGKENGQFATGSQQLGEFDGGDEVTTVRSAGRRSVKSGVNMIVDSSKSIPFFKERTCPSRPWGPCPR